MRLSRQAQKPRNPVRTTDISHCGIEFSRTPFAHWSAVSRRNMFSRIAINSNSRQQRTDNSAPAAAGERTTGMSIRRTPQSGTRPPHRPDRRPATSRQDRLAHPAMSGLPRPMKAHTLASLAACNDALDRSLVQDENPSLAAPVPLTPYILANLNIPGCPDVSDSLNRKPLFSE